MLNRSSPCPVVDCPTQLICILISFCKSRDKYKRHSRVICYMSRWAASFGLCPLTSFWWKTSTMTVPGLTPSSGWVSSYSITFSLNEENYYITNHSHHYDLSRWELRGRPRVQETKARQPSWLIPLRCPQWWLRMMVTIMLIPLRCPLMMMISSEE